MMERCHHDGSVIKQLEKYLSTVMRHQTARCAGALITLAMIATEGHAFKQENQQLQPILFVPGYGMSALTIEVNRKEKKATSFNFLLPAMNPNTIFAKLNPPASNALDYAIQSGLKKEDINLVRNWLKLKIDNNGKAHNQEDVIVRPISIGEDFAKECPRYIGMMEKLTSMGWAANKNLMCVPYDYRYAPGYTAFVDNLRKQIIKHVSEHNQKTTIACHSQGCLLAYHFLRTQDQGWVERHIGLFFSMAGQFSGCSDCLRWAFQKEWSWNHNADANSPSDMSWVGELALGLQTSVYGDHVLYRWGETSYRADDVRRLLKDARADAMERATGHYALDNQNWFLDGVRDRKPLAVATRIVFGTELRTTIGFDFVRGDPPQLNCDEPQCGGLYKQDHPDSIESWGDQGDSDWMNRAPGRWLGNPKCEIKEYKRVSHMDIVENEKVLTLLKNTIQDINTGIGTCALQI